MGNLPRWVRDEDGGDDHRAVTGLGRLDDEVVDLVGVLCFGNGFQFLDVLESDLHEAHEEDETSM